MILFNRFSGNVINHASDIHGRWLMVAIELNGVHYILLCLYGYNNRSQNKQSYLSLIGQLERWRVTYSTDKVIMGGDFKLVVDRWWDRLPPRGQCHNYEEILVEFTSRGNLVDCWRMRNTFIKQYTWHNSANNGQCSRLDFWFISTSLINMVHKCEISASPLGDIIVYRGDGFKPIPNVQWKFNSRLLEQEEFCNEVKNLVKEIVDLDLSPLMKWEWFKFKIREIAINASKLISRQKKQKQQSLIREINNLCHKTDLALDQQVKSQKLQNQLDNLYLEKAKGAFIRSRARWIEEGEKNTSYFFSLEKHRQTKKKIHKLLINNTVIDHQNQVNEEIRTFYNNLYKSKFSAEDCNSLFDKFRGFEKKLTRALCNIWRMTLKSKNLT